MLKRMGGGITYTYPINKAIGHVLKPNDSYTSIRNRNYLQYLAVIKQYNGKSNLISSNVILHVYGVSKVIPRRKTNEQE